MKKNMQDQKIKGMPAGVKHYLSPAPQHRPVAVDAPRQQLKGMPKVTNYVGGGGTRSINVKTGVSKQKIK